MSEGEPTVISTNDGEIVLQQVDGRTNEEDEVVELSLRAKLYRYDAEGGEGWKERGELNKMSEGEPTVISTNDGEIVLQQVDGRTNEEDEVVELSLRAKLYRYDAEGGEGWKERGIGEVKFLRNPETNKTRLLMRREQTLKICANHFISEFMELNAHAGSDKSWVWSTPADFADEVESPETLAIRFNSVENAQNFKEKFDELKVFGATEEDQEEAEDQAEAEAEDQAEAEAEDQAEAEAEEED
eukprot:TRINITY_DN29_c0_g2_i1.p1 TRINITY_DN29_c0_g2~~TRINITY_DN29_c0_g2_i1.p1  ORF type:complete len:255 (-),score=105.83 TRINITY_DN29_c0_g2_i1:85-813(-)